MTVKRTEGEPHDRLTRIGAELLDHLDGMAADDVRAVIILETDERCATVLRGFESDAHAMAAIFGHLAAVMKVNGKELVVVPFGKEPGRG